MAYQYPFKAADEALKLRVWDKSRTIQGYDSKLWRHDKCGQVMKYTEHGNTDSKHGWEIDHIKPTSKGGTDAIENLQALNWQVNRSKGDTYPWDCSMFKA